MKGYPVSFVPKMYRPSSSGHLRSDICLAAVWRGWLGTAGSVSRSNPASIECHRRVGSVGPAFFVPASMHDFQGSRYHDRVPRLQHVIVDLGVLDHFVIVDASAFLLPSDITDELHVAGRGELRKASGK